MPDGTYIVQFDEAFQGIPIFKFEIKGDKFTYIGLEGNKRTKRNIEKNNDCCLMLEKMPVAKSENQSDVQKLLNTQNPYFEIEQIAKGVYKFTERVDLHITSSQGKFFRLQ